MGGDIEAQPSQSWGCESCIVNEPPENSRTLVLGVSIMPRISVELSPGTFTEFSLACRKDYRKKAEQIRLLIERWLNEREGNY